MTHEEFFDALWQMVKDTDVDFEELLDDGDEGGVFVRFTNVQVADEHPLRFDPEGGA